MRALSGQIYSWSKCFWFIYQEFFQEMLSKSFLTFDFKVFCLTDKRNYIQYIVKRQKDEELNRNLQLVRSICHLLWSIMSFVDAVMRCVACCEFSK